MTSKWSIWSASSACLTAKPGYRTVKTVLSSISKFLIQLLARYSDGVDAIDGPKIPGYCVRCGGAGDVLIERYCGDRASETVTDFT
jgi:hypothetical protein